MGEKKKEKLERIYCILTREMCARRPDVPPERNKPPPEKEKKKGK